MSHPNQTAVQTYARLIAKHTRDPKSFTEDDFNEFLTVLVEVLAQPRGDVAKPDIRPREEVLRGLLVNASPDLAAAIAKELRQIRGSIFVDGNGQLKPVTSL